MGYANVPHVSRGFHILKKLVILDLDNTLYQEEDYIKAVFSSFEKKYNLAPGKLVKARSQVQRDKSGDFLKEVLQAAQMYTRELHDELFDIYSAGEFDLQLPTSTVEFLGEIKRRNYLSAILTNGVPLVQRNKIRALNLAGQVDFIFCARHEILGYEKPDPRAFQMVLEETGFKEYETVMVGDNLENDVMGARDIGIDAFWLMGHGDGAVSDLSDIFKLIDGVNL